MPRPPHHRRHRTAAALVAALAATGCAHTADLSTPPSTHPQATRSVATQPDPDGQRVCGDFISLALSSDTSTDAGPADARRRAAQRHGTPELEDLLTAGGVDHTWAALTEHRARIEVRVAPVGDDPPRRREGLAAAAVNAMRTAIGITADGSPWRELLPDVVAHCALTAVDGGWRVTTVQLSDAGASTPAPSTPGGGR